ncbi:DUF6083 domain-containing protein [Streptomyces sp. NPDC051954]|uniref:DUF6083 domain-containing protein n=1 Tax=Streptomyces sp. NPDC051954 TaxID=3155524 RepID=UPI00344723F3
MPLSAGPASAKPPEQAGAHAWLGRRQRRPAVALRPDQLLPRVRQCRRVIPARRRPPGAGAPPHELPAARVPESCPWHVSRDIDHPAGGGSSWCWLANDLLRLAGLGVVGCAAAVRVAPVSRSAHAPSARRRSPSSACHTDRRCATG